MHRVCKSGGLRTASSAIPEGLKAHVMSDDPNFNPNGQLNGNWTSLQPVRPQP